MVAVTRTNADLVSLAKEVRHTALSHLGLLPTLRDTQKLDETMSQATDVIHSVLG